MAGERRALLPGTRIEHRISFDDTTCAIREEVLSLDDLNRLTVFHEKGTPGRDVEPIVVLSFRGQRYVIDGNKRVNAWRKTGKPQARRAIIIEPTAEGYANWLMRPGPIGVRRAGAEEGKR